MKKKRDNNVKAIYELENHELPYGFKFKTLDEIRDFVSFVTGSATWRNDSRLPQSIRVYSLGDMDYSESREPNEIWMAYKHWDQQVVLHELAHFVAPKEHHGPAFVNAYLNLVARFMGKEFFDRYLAAFKREGIRCV